MDCGDNLRDNPNWNEYGSWNMIFLVFVGTPMKKDMAWSWRMMKQGMYNHKDDERRWIVNARITCYFVLVLGFTFVLCFWMKWKVLEFIIVATNTLEFGIVIWFVVLTFELEWFRFVYVNWLMNEVRMALY